MNVVLPDRLYVHLCCNLDAKRGLVTFPPSLTLVCEEHLGERRHPDQEVQHGAAVGVVRAVVVRLHGGHGVVLTYALPVLLLQVLRERENNKATVTPAPASTSSAAKG